MWQLSDQIVVCSWPCIFSLLRKDMEQISIRPSPQVKLENDNKQRFPLHPNTASKEGKVLRDDQIDSIEDLYQKLNTVLEMLLLT